MNILKNKIPLSLVAVSLASTALYAADKEVKKPNIIFILADDLGYSELGCFGNTFNETPNIDKLAQNGIKFSNAYTAQTVSSPTRAALMTGLYPARTGIIDYLRPDDSKHLDEKYTTMPEVLKMDGYHTCIIGKWHLTGYIRGGAKYESSPDKHGFEEVILSENQGIGNGTYFFPYEFNLDVEKLLTSSKEFLVDRLNEEATRFIDRQQKDKPFFLYLSHYAVHTQVHGKPEDVDYFRQKANAGKSDPSLNNPENDPYKKWPADYRAGKNNPHLAAQLKDIDKGVGEIIAELKKKGLYDNTLIIFTSDNGGELNVTKNVPLRGGKSYLYEGGIRNRAIISAPAFLPTGKEIKENIVTFDYLPTFCDMLHINTKNIYQKMDGVSLWPLITGKVETLKPRTLYWHYPLEHPHFLGGRSAATVQDGGWKLIQFYDTGEVELYNLSNDISESKNIISKHLDIAQKLMKELDAWRKDVGVTVPAQ